MHASSTWDDFERNLIFLSESNFGSAMRKQVVGM